MKYMLIPLAYWPIWLAFRAYEMSAIGIFVGAASTIAAWLVCWRIDFGTWRIGSLQRSRHD